MMMKILLVAAAVAVSAQFKHVDFTIYATGDCSGDGDVHQAGIGVCHKGRGDDYAMLSCTSDGSQMIVQTYSDEGCKTAKDKHVVDCGKCMQPPNVTDHSIKISCNKDSANELKELEDFEKFVADHDKKYEDVLEYHYRLSVFLKNLKVIEKLNEASPGVYGIGPFADLTEEEFNMYYTGYNPPMESEFGERVEPRNVTAGDVDWREKDAITPVKDQGRCGSCWAFSATESVESLAFLSGKYPLTLMSTQQITACDKGSSGCGGGWPGSAFNYLKGTSGLEKDADYPYTAGGGSTGSCKYVSSKAYEKVTGYKTLAKGEDSMAKGLMDQPMSVCHQTGGWQHYSAGSVMSSCSSGGGHCTQIVGYNSDKGGYWIIKNSWAERWGNKGYLWLKKGDNLCGISNSAMYPQIA